MRSVSVWRTVWLGVMTGLSALLMYLEIALPFFPSYLKYDLGDFPALVAGFALGPIAGITVEIGKEVLFMLLRGGTPVGVAANILAGIVWVGTASFIYHRLRTKTGAVISLVVSGLVLTVVMSTANWFVFLPLWGIPAEAIPATVMTAILPFNLVKTGLTSLVTFVLYKRVRQVFEVPPALEPAATRDRS